MAEPLKCSSTMSLALTAASGGGATKLVSPASPGTLLATIRKWDGTPLADTLVTFSSTDFTAGMVPAAGTALTDANGVARIGLQAGTRVGAFTAAASATVAGSTLQASTPYVVSFPALALGPLGINPSPLSAGGNAAVSVTVLSDGQTYTPPLQVRFSSPCASAGKATIGSPVTTQNGVARASYTDKGCGVPDTITASVTLGESTVTQDGTVIVQTAAAGSISFTSSDTTNIALVGTGGAGRQEFATLRFKVYDSTGTPLSGAPVNFTFADRNGSQVTSTTGGLALHPANATTDDKGEVTTLVSGGTIPTSVRVKASVPGTQLTTLSNVLVVSTGVPDQKHFSLSTETGNCEGWSLDQDECSIVTVRMADHFGNPVPDGTAVNFSVEGGNVEASCITGTLLTVTSPKDQSTNSRLGSGSGACSVRLRSANPRPDEPYIAPDALKPGQISRRGRVTLMAWALGEEDFTDVNGNNRCDGCDTTSSAAGAEFTPAQDKRPDIYRDDDESRSYTAGEPCVGPNGSGKCDTPADGRYNGVLRTPLAPATAPSTYISGQLVQIFSGSEAFITFEQDKVDCSAGGTAPVKFRVRDVNGNPMPAGTTIGLTALYGVSTAPVIPGTITVNNYVLGVGDPTPQPLYEAAVGCGGRGTLIVTVTTPVRKVETTATLPIVGQ